MIAEMTGSNGVFMPLLQQPSHQQQQTHQPGDVEAQTQSGIGNQQQRYEPFATTEEPESVSMGAAEKRAAPPAAAAAAAAPPPGIVVDAPAEEAEVETHPALRGERDSIEHA